LIVTDKPLRDLGVVDRATAALADADIDIAFYDGVLPDPTYEHVAEGVAVAKTHGSEAILAIGGGSSIDAAKIIANLDMLDLKEHPDFGAGTICTLKTEGGYQKYCVVVPESARFEVNRLLVPGESIQYAIEDMKRLVDTFAFKSDVDVDIKPPKYEPYVSTKDEPLMKILDTVYVQVMGKTPLYEYAYGITNANIFQGEQCIPCIHIGPQRGGAHQPNEYVKLKWLPPISEIYTRIALEFLQEANY